VSGSLVFGLHAVRAVLARRPKDVLRLAIIAGRDDARVRELRALAAAQGIAPVAATAETLDRETGGAVHQGVVAEVRPSAALDENSLLDLLTGLAGPALVLVLDGVSDPHNLGACLRTADAAGATAVVAPRDRAAGLTPVVRKVAAGAAETVPFAQVTNLARSLRDMKAAGLWIAGTAEDGDQELFAADLTGPLALVMGSEGRGLRRLTRECCDFTLRLPMLGTVGSLNVSVAAGITLYEALRQRRAKLAESQPVR
jgi:23S rRNA (guanosine2251-2'-O)-methyltransferase